MEPENIEILDSRGCEAENCQKHALKVERQEKGQQQR